MSRRFVGFGTGSGGSGVTSITAGTGLTGGTITTTGTIALSSPVTPANGGVANVTTLGGQFLALNDYTISGEQPNLQVTGLANRIYAIVFIQRYSQTVGHVTVRTPTTLGAGALWSTGVYDSTGTLGFYTGALDGTITTAQMVTAKNAAGSSTSYVMAPGVYYLATTATVAGAGNTNASAFSSSSAVVLQFINNANANRQVISATATVNAVLPSAIGSLSADATGLAIPAVFVEP